MNAQSYLQKHSYADELIRDHPDPQLTISVIIPSYNEPNLMDTLHSLLSVKAITGIVEVCVILNHSENTPNEIKNFHHLQYLELQKLAEKTSNNHIRIKSVHPIELPHKWAGVGMARKLGMDEAIRRFSKIGTEGILLNLDADCYVEPGYLHEMDLFFKEHSTVQACSLGFLHHSKSCDQREREAIIWYELHLRLYINWQKKFNYPFAFQTLGSCFGVRTDAYRQQGGMNRRKAGEDFYFLHKFSAINKLAAIDKVLVHPSGRISDRVPFGTGKSIGQIVAQLTGDKSFLSYNPLGIASFCTQLQEWKYAFVELRKYPGDWKNRIREPSLFDFLESVHFSGALEEMIHNCQNPGSFEKRLSRYFNPFLLMKYLHFAEQLSLPKVPIQDSFKNFVANGSYPAMRKLPFEPFQALEFMRRLDYPDYQALSL